MTTLLTDLLPSERQRALMRSYRLRLGVVIIWFISALAFISSILLIPTYILLAESARAKQANLANIESTVTSADQSSLSARLTTLQDAVATLAELDRIPAVSEMIRAVLAIGRPGVALTGLSYAPATVKTARTITVSGNAATREALRTYQLALESAPFARLASLPVSAYAKDRNIAFSIIVTLAP